MRRTIGTRKDKLYAVNPDGTVKWYFQTGDWIDSSPAIAPDGTIYVGSDDNYLMAINPDGTLKWAFKTRDDVNSSPVIDSDGTVYVGSDDGYLYAVNPDGTEKWSEYLGRSVTSAPIIGNNGIIYVGSHPEGLYAIESGTSGYADSPWPMFHQNPQHTGRNESATASHCIIPDKKYLCRIFRSSV